MGVSAAQIGRTVVERLDRNVGKVGRGETVVGTAVMMELLTVLMVVVRFGTGVKVGRVEATVVVVEITVEVGRGIKVVVAGVVVVVVVARVVVVVVVGKGMKVVVKGVVVAVTVAFVTGGNVKLAGSVI